MIQIREPLLRDLIFSRKDPIIHNIIWIPRIRITSLKTLTKKYIKIKSHIINKYKLFFEKNLKNKKVLGVYLRGGEFRTIPNHDYPPTVKQIINKVSKILKNLFAKYSYSSGTQKTFCNFV